MLEEEKQLVPMDEIRKMLTETGGFQSTKNQSNLSEKLDEAFSDYLNSDNDDIQKAVNKSNKRTFKKLGKSKEKVTGDIADTNVYQARYDREEWYYKRHKDTIDRYASSKKDEKKNQSKNKDELVATITNEPEEVTRIGLAKMAVIVWFDLLIRTILFDYIICSPFQLVRAVAELFYRMKKSIAITVGIITGIIVVTLGLIFGVQAIMNYVQSLSNL